MVEVPEHLLQRSRERRAALGGAPATGGPTPAAGAAPPAEEAAPAAAVEAAAPAADAPAVVATAETAPVPAVETPPAYVPPPNRTGIPRWVMPVLVLLPFWAIVYMGAFGTAKTGAAQTPAQEGATIYAKNCSPCHGARGEGGVGPKLAGGEAKLTFPDEAAHIEWVTNGSSLRKGQPYGDPARSGGQHIAKTGGMPSFAATLNPNQVKFVVEYERNTLQ